MQVIFLVGSIPCGFNPVQVQSVRVQSRAGSIPCGFNPLWVQSCMCSIPCVQFRVFNPVWVQSRVGSIPCGFNPVWVQFRGFNPVWVQSRWNRFQGSGYLGVTHKHHYTDKLLDTCGNTRSSAKDDIVHRLNIRLNSVIFSKVSI